MNNEKTQSRSALEDSAATLRKVLPGYSIEEYIKFFEAFAVMSGSPRVTLTENGPRPRAKYEEIGKFCVWTKTGRRPQYYHPTQELAMEEAERLSLKYPGQKFIVMQMIGKFGTPPVEELT